MKCLGINLTKYVQDLYVENYETMMKERVEREARKDKDKALVQINMRGEQRKRNPQKRLRRNDRNTEEESGRILSEKLREMRVFRRN